jgi:calcineurin-like phosphoesterase family protein
VKKIFFTADTHFGHGEIINFENRPFKNVEEMDEILIQNWNNTVSENDKIFILGDFAFGKKEEIQKYIQALNGYKILVMGNHDRVYPLSWWQNTGIEEVIQYPVIYKEWFILSHEPLYINKNMPYANIFGHVHGNPLYTDVSRQSFCVSAERINYTPLEFHKITEKMKATEDHGRDI